jgi:hypothetical protein
MPKLIFKQNFQDSSRFGLLVAAKVKEMIEYYEVSSLLLFQKEFNEWIISIPRKNAYSIDNAFRLKVENSKATISKHFMGSEKEPKVFFEIWEEVNHG